MNVESSSPPKPTLPVTARILPEEVAQIIGCAKHDIPILTRAGLLKPLGHPPAEWGEILLPPPGA